MTLYNPTSVVINRYKTKKERRKLIKAKPLIEKQLYNKLVKINPIKQENME